MRLRPRRSHEPQSSNQGGVGKKTEQQHSGDDRQRFHGLPLTGHGNRPGALGAPLLLAAVWCFVWPGPFMSRRAVMMVVEVSARAGGANDRSCPARLTIALTFSDSNGRLGSRGRYELLGRGVWREVFVAYWTVTSPAEDTSISSVSPAKLPLRSMVMSRPENSTAYPSPVASPISVTVIVPGDSQ